MNVILPKEAEAGVVRVTGHPGNVCRTLSQKQNAKEKCWGLGSSGKVLA
jgi:hypothetical protein